MVRLYNSHHHSCFFYLASILVDEYGSENDCIGGLISMLDAMLSRAFQLLQEPQLHKVSATIRSFFPNWSIPHGVERLVVMWNDWITWKLKIFHLSQEKLPFELRDRLLSTVLRLKGQVLISTLITASIFSLSTCSLPNVADVLLEIMLVDRQVSSNSFCLNLFTFVDHFFISWCRVFLVGWSKH